jgi:hypothetical protein
MSAYALLIGHPHGGEKPPIVISGPDVSYADTREAYQKFAQHRAHEDFERIDFVDSRSGVRKKKKFITPEEAKKRAAAIKRDEKAANPPAKKATKKAAKNANAETLGNQTSETPAPGPSSDPLVQTPAENPDGPPPSNDSDESNDDDTGGEEE